MYMEYVSINFFSFLSSEFYNFPHIDLGHILLDLYLSI